MKRNTNSPFITHFLRSVKKKGAILKQQLLTILKIFKTKVQEV